jgi:hypothetical protein
MASPHNIVAIVGSIRKESYTLKIANALAKLAPTSLKLDVTTLHGISFFNQDLEANPPADWLALREKIQQSLDSRCPEKRHRCRLASLWQELVSRQTDRHRQQFAGTARRRQCGKTPAKHSAGYFRADPRPTRNLSQRRWRRLRR